MRILLALLLLLPLGGWGQNLVNNPSFENTSACPIGISEFNRALNWDESNSGNDTCSTPDLYAACSPQFGGANSPDALMGYQRSRTGTHHAGVILREFLSSWREYIQGSLSSPLVAGQEYCVRFYINTANESRFSTDAIGIYFSNAPLQKDFCTNPGPHSVTPQLQYIGPPIADSINWIPLEWSYIASGGEQYLTIGNFKSNVNTTLVDFNTNIGASLQLLAYYFIDDVEVTQTTCCPVVEVDTIIDVSCHGNTDGSATVSPVGGIPPYSYSWPAGGGNNATGINLPAGSHIVTVSDSRGCVVTKRVDIREPNALTVSVTSSNTSCGTSATATPSGGTAPFSYAWSNGAVGASISNMPTGTYTVTVTDVNGCMTSGSVSVTQSSSFTVSLNTNNSSCNICDGTASPNISGGIPPFSFDWSDGQTTQMANNLCPGIYTVTVTESGGSGGNVFWSEDFSGGGVGWTLNINGTGTNGADANEWVINNNASQCTPCPTGGGNYLHITCTSLTCTLSGDAGSCVYDQGVPIFADAATDKYVTSPNISTVGKTGITLTFSYMSGGESGADYGLVRLSNNGGTSWTDLPTQYSGTATCTQASVSIPAIYENLPDFRIGFRWINDNNTNGDDPPFMIDEIELSATGGSACTATASFNIGSAGGPDVSTASLTDVTCNGDGDGAINLNVSGGNPPYSYLWSNGAITKDIVGLDGGNYIVTVSDNNNCDTVLNFTITEPPAMLITSSVVDTACGGTGSIDLNITGGATPYSYLWTNGSTTQDLDSIPGGTYTVTVTDFNGCSQTESFSLSPPGNFLVNLAPVDALCEGSADGSISTSVTGGVSPYQYLWSNGDTSADLTGVQAGNYQVTVSDDNNCTSSESSVVGAPNPLFTSASITRVNCQGDNDGGIKLIPTGGTPPYAAQWSHGDSLLSIADLAAGVYAVTLTDQHGCTYDTSFALNSYSSFDLEVMTTDASCDGSVSGRVQANIISGNAPPYSYNWDSGDTTATVTGLSPGTYIVTVLDSFGCVKSAIATITVTGLTIEADVTNASCPSTPDGAIYTTVSGGVSPYKYMWNNGGNTASLTNIRAGTYSLTVTDQEDCSGQDTIIVLSDSTLTDCDTLIIYNVFSPNSDGKNDRWVIDGLGTYPENDLQIFNRWGNVVYEANPYDNSWDGYSKKGEPLPSATYYYILKLNDPDESVYSGDVTIIR